MARERVLLPAASQGSRSPRPRHSQAAQAQVALQQLSVPENTGCSPFLSSFREHRLTW